MLLFWQHGYTNTSIQRLGEHMEMHPGSLYAAFKNKRQLFLEALECYFQRSSQQLQVILKSGDTPLQGVRSFFQHLVEQILSESSVNGCLMVNTATELAEGQQDESIRVRLQEMFESHERQLSEALRQAQAEGELRGDADPERVARYLFVGVRGVRLYGLLRPPREALQGVVDDLLSVLER